MIDKPTVFILGAGASVPYGYPTGEGLRRDICDNFVKRIATLTQSTNPISGPDISYFIKQEKKFTDTFLKSSTPSIDLFLARNPEFADIGKIAIVISILEAEEKSRFREQVDTELDWYSYLFRKMTEDMIDPESYINFYKNEVSFITFNYDRSLEYFLFDSLRNSFIFAPESEIIKQFSKINIFHVYGAIDKLPWQKGYYTQYREKPSYSTIEILSKNIKIIHERTISEDDSKSMKDIIMKASRIFFLGFGYARENLEMLEIPSIFNVNQKIYGTAFNLIDKEIDEIKVYLSKYFRADDSLKPFKPVISNMDSRTFLRHWL